MNNDHENLLNFDINIRLLQLLDIVLSFPIFLDNMDHLFSFYIDVLNKPSINISSLVVSSKNLAKFVTKYPFYLDNTIEFILSSFKKRFINSISETSKSADNIPALTSLILALKEIFIEFKEEFKKYNSYQILFTNLFVMIQKSFYENKITENFLLIVTETSVCILESLTYVMKNSSENKLDKQTIVNLKELRTIWLYLYLFKIKLNEISCAGSWGYIENTTKMLAVMTPPLVFNRGGSGLSLLEDPELKFAFVNSSIDNNANTISFLKLSKEFLKIDISKLSSNHIFLLSSIYLLETQRMNEVKNVTGILPYITDETFSSCPILFKKLLKLFIHLNEVYIDNMKLEMQNENSQKNAVISELGKNLEFYIMNSYHANKDVRTICSKFILEYVKNFPFLLSKKNPIFLCLYSLRILNDTKDKLKPGISSNVPRFLMEIEFSKFNIFLPKNENELSAAFKNLYSVTYLVISVGILFSPDIITSILNEYLMLSESFREPICVEESIIREFFLHKKPSFHLIDDQNASCERKEASRDVLKLISTHFHSIKTHENILIDNFNIDLSIKSKFNGEAMLMCDKLDTQKKLILLEFEGLNFLNKITKVDVDEKIIYNNFWKIIALIRVIINNDLHLEINANVLYPYFLILSSIIDYLPSNEATTTLLKGFTWLIIGCNKIEYRVVNVILLLIQNSIQNKAGLFDPFISEDQNIEKCSLLSTNKISYIPQFNSKSQLSLNSVFLFFDDQLNSFGKSYLKLLFNTLSGSLQAILINSSNGCHKHDMIERFQLLCLSLKVISFSITSSSSSCIINSAQRRILREKIYSVALNWFASSPKFLDKDEKLSNSSFQSFDILYNFYISLEEDKNFWEIDYAEIAPMNCEFSNITGIYIFSGKYFENYSKLTKKTKTNIEAHLNSYALNNSSSCNSFCLLRFCIISQIDHLTSWFQNIFYTDILDMNVRKSYHEKLNHFNLLYNKIVRSEKTSSSFIYLAWCYEPKLSIVLSGLLSNSNTLESLKNIVGRHISAVRHLWLAATIVTEFHRYTYDNYAATVCSNELLALTPCPAHIVIEILNRCDKFNREKPRTKLFRASHSAPGIIRYAIRSLSALPITVLQFYLPQLIQLLRRDTFGVLSNFLESLAKRSALMCHNLVWLLQTESVETVNHHTTGSSPYPHHGYCNQIIGQDSLPRRANELLTVIMSVLPEKDLSYLKSECNFFNSVTNISAKLTKIKDKDLHNQVIKEELTKLKLPSNLYLPTQPDRLVVSIDCDSGIPMQSAAKCPFLLCFNTMPWKGPDHLDSNNNNNNNNSNRNNNKADENFNEFPIENFNNSSGSNSPSVLFENKLVIDRPLKMTSDTISINRGVKRWNIKSNDIDSSNRGNKTDSLIRKDACIFKVYDDCRQDTLVMQVRPSLDDTTTHTHIYIYIYII